MNSMPSMRYETELSCGHKVLWRQRAHVPRMRERVYCHECQDMRMVIGVPGSWRGVCRKCGFDQSRQTLSAIHKQVFNHLERNADHTVYLYNYDKSEEYDVSWPTRNEMGRKELSLFDLEA